MEGLFWRPRGRGSGPASIIRPLSSSLLEVNTTLLRCILNIKYVQVSAVKRFIPSQKKSFYVIYVCVLCIFTFMHLADAFIQNDLQCIQAIHLYCQYVFPGNRTHNLCTAKRDALPLSHRNTFLLCIETHTVYINTHTYSIYVECIYMYIFI